MKAWLDLRLSPAVLSLSATARIFVCPNLCRLKQRSKDFTASILHLRYSALQKYAVQCQSRQICSSSFHRSAETAPRLYLVNHFKNEQV